MEITMQFAPSFSRSYVIELADIPGTQLDYLVKLGVVAPDLGGKRKRFSLEEAILVILASRALRGGLAANKLEEPFRWLRDEIHKQEHNGLFENIQMCAEDGLTVNGEYVGAKPLFVHFAFLPDGQWKCLWSNNVEAVEGAELFQVFDLRLILKSVKDRMGVDA